MQGARRNSPTVLSPDSIALQLGDIVFVRQWHPQWHCDVREKNVCNLSADGCLLPRPLGLMFTACCEKRQTSGSPVRGIPGTVYPPSAPFLTHTQHKGQPCNSLVSVSHSSAQSPGPMPGTTWILKKGEHLGTASKTEAASQRVACLPGIVQNI